MEKYFKSTKTDKGKLFGLNFRDRIDGEIVVSLNCWRGYQAIYKIENDSLFVDAIIDCNSIKNRKQKTKNYIKEVFGKKIKKDKVFIDWYSGIINFPTRSKKNKVIRWDKVFEKTYLFETIIKVKKGKVIQVVEQKNYEDLNNGTDRLNEKLMRNFLFKQIQNYRWAKLEKNDCSELYTITIGKNGKVVNVKMTEYQTKKSIKDFWDKREYRYCIKSFKKALAKVQFDILKRKGKPVDEKVYMEIWFKEDGSIESITD